MGLEYFYVGHIRMLIMLMSLGPQVKLLHFICKMLVRKCCLPKPSPVIPIPFFF